MSALDRRTFLKGVAVSAGAVALGGALGSTAALAAAPRPLPDATFCQFGIDIALLGTTNTFPQELNDHRPVYNNLDFPHVRIFADTPVTWSDARYQACRVGDKPVQSFKTWNLPAFNAWMTSIPANVPEAWICYFHEPEDNIKTGPLTPTQYRNTYQNMHNARVNHANGNKVRLVKIFMRYQQVIVPTPQTDWHNLHGGQMFVDALGMDCYDSKAALDNGYLTGPELLGEARSMGAETGLNWCVPEIGAVLSGTDPGSGRYQAMKNEWVPYLKATRDGAGPALWANWWCAAGNEGSGKDYHLDTYPGALQVWRDQMAASQ